MSVMNRVRLSTRAPFHLEATVRVLQRRPTNVVDVWHSGRYLRVLTVGAQRVLVEVTNGGTVAAPDVRFKVLRTEADATSPAVLGQMLRKMLGLDIDPAPIAQLTESERRLRPTAIALRGMRPPRFAELFEAFGNVVPFQQVSLDAGVAIVGRLVTRYGAALDYDGRRFYGFPTAHVIASARLSALGGCGLSRRKAEALRRIARAIASGTLDEEKLALESSGEAERLLTQLDGIGPWSASLVLLRGLGRLDVFPPGDVGATRGLHKLMHLESTRALERLVQRFGQYRGYLYFCSLGSNLLARGLIHAAVRDDRACAATSSPAR